MTDGVANEVNDGVIRFSDLGRKPEPLERVPTGLGDAVWGGGVDRPGIVLGSVTVLAGPPAAGASTLCLQLLGRVAQAARRPGLYVNTMEAMDEVRRRADRVGVKAADVLGLDRWDTREPHDEELLNRWRPSIVIIDAIRGGSSVARQACESLCGRMRKLASGSRNASPPRPPIPVVLVYCDWPNEQAPPFREASALLYLSMAEEIQGPDRAVHHAPTNEPFRILASRRSHFGPCSEAYFTMDEEGLKPFELPEKSKKAGSVA